MKKILALLLVLLVCFSVVGCGNDSEKETNNSEIEETEEETSVEVNKKLLNVEVTIPPFLLDSEDGELDMDEIVEDAKEEGIKDVRLNEDGSITYTMSKAKHKEMMEEMKEDLLEMMDDLVEDEDFASIKKITANKDFTEFDLLVIREQFENGLDSFGVLGIVFSSAFYQMFDGSDPGKYQTIIHFQDEGTGEVYDTVTYPDAFEE